MSYNKIYNEVYNRMIQMERASARNHILIQKYKVMWEELKGEIYSKKQKMKRNDAR